jgi:hypothetical protein
MNTDSWISGRAQDEQGSQSAGTGYAPSAGGCAEEREYGVLHVFPQYSNHDEAYIAGTPGELRVLRDAINEALLHGEAEMGTFASDGEGYEIHIVAVDDATSQLLATAYTADYCEESRPNALHPYDILRQRYDAKVQSGSCAKPEGHLRQEARPDEQEFCRFPECRCPFDPGPSPDWCARGLPHARQDEQETDSGVKP